MKTGCISAEVENFPHFSLTLFSPSFSPPQRCDWITVTAAVTSCLEQTHVCTAEKINASGLVRKVNTFEKLNSLEYAQSDQNLHSISHL